MTSTNASSPYLMVHPRLSRQSGGSERRKSERFRAHFEIDLKSQGDERVVSVNASRSGLLVIGRVLLPVKQLLMLKLHLPDGPLLAMAVVVRHTLVDGQPAMGIRFLALPRKYEGRWFRAILEVAEARSREELIDRPTVDAPPPRPGEYHLCRLDPA